MWVLFTKVSHFVNGRNSSRSNKDKTKKNDETMRLKKGNVKSNRLNIYVTIDHEWEMILVFFVGLNFFSNGHKKYF